MASPIQGSKAANTGTTEASTTTNTSSNNDGSTNQRRRKRRWGASAAGETASAAATTSSTTATSAAPAKAAPTGPVDSKAKALALKASIAARLAALKSKTAGKTTAASASAIRNKRPLPPPPPASTTTTSTSAAPVAKRAKHYELDMTVTGPTFQKSTGVASKPKPKLNPYLAHRQETTESFDNANGKSAQEKGSSDGVDVGVVDLAASKIDPSENQYVDARLEAAGHDAALIGRRHRRRELKFVEPGTFVEIGERKRQRAANAESAGFASGRKAGQYFRPTTMMAGSGGGDTNYYGTTEVLDDVEDRGVLAPRAEIGSTSLEDKAHSNLRAMPMVVEWWDMELLPSKLKKQVSGYEGSALNKATQSKMQQFAVTASALSSAFAAKDNGAEGKEGEASEGATTSATTVTIDKAGELRKKCSELASLSYSKTASLIQHIIPIPPFGETGKEPVEPVLHLTKKERKRARKRRREQKQRELQDLQAAGLIEPPEPRLTLQNFIRVMGDQAYVDPSQMERKVMEQVQKRQLAHLDRNASKKLTREQRADKLRSKVTKDATPSSNASGAIHVALFFVKNVSHPYHRTKIDLNAQQLSITGGVIECDFPAVSCVICEGGPRAIQKYQRLMLVRMKWKGPDDEGDDYDEESEEEDAAEEEEVQYDEDGEPIPKKIKHRFDRENHCELVWTGMATKRQFKGFVFQHCETSAQARKVLRSKGVGKYWEQVLAHASGSGDSLNLKLVDSDSENENDDENGADNMDVDDANTATA